MQLFYAPDFKAEDHFISLPKDESHHCVKVLRMSIGQEIFVTNGKGTIIQGVISENSPSACIVKINDTLPDSQKRTYRIHLAVAPTKVNDRIEWLLEKATEIGVDHITPIICSRSERKVFNHQRAEKIIVSAAKQSLKATFPVLDEAVDFVSFIKNTECKSKFIAHCLPNSREEFKDKIAHTDDICILIGPEGDFSQKEIDTALAKGYSAVTLGKSRLRTETAALFAVATVAVLKNS